MPLDGFWEWSGDLFGDAAGVALDIAKDKHSAKDQNNGGNATVADKVTTAPPAPVQKDNTALYVGAGFGGLVLILLLVLLVKGGK